MSQPGDCPSNEELLDAALGQATIAVAEKVHQHLMRCPMCAAAFAERRREIEDAGMTVTHLGETLAEVSERDSEVFDYSILSPSNRQPSLGKLGGYEIECKLGAGGFGVVFKAFDERLMRTIAIKVLKRDLALSSVARRRFMREARAAAAINHPNVVTIHAVEEHDGLPFIVMECVMGPSLRERILSAPKLSPVQIITISAQMAAGLAAAHAQGVIHRDIKPSNMMMEDGLERIKITDFGLARVTLDNQDLTTRELAVGTPAYMSPEQISGKTIDVRSDLFGLGCVMYAMHTGHSPFSGRNALEMARKVTEKIPQPLAKVDSSVPRLTSDLVERLLQKDPEDRIQSAAEVSELLSRQVSVLNATPSDQLSAVLKSVRMDAKSPRLVSMLQRHATWLAVGLVCVLAVGSSWWMSRDPFTWFSSAATQAEPQDPLDEVPSPKLSQVRVDQAGQGDCQSLQEALEMLAPGGTVTVLDAAVYDEALVIDDAQRWAGISIVADRGAALSASNAACLIRIESTPGVELRGFKLLANKSQRGIELLGPCPGVRFIDIHAADNQDLDAPSQPVSFVHLRESASGTEEAPIVFRSVNIYGRPIALVVGEVGNSPDDNLGWVKVEDCTFVGTDDDHGYRVVIYPGVRHLELTRNTFALGRCALSVSLDRSDDAEQISHLTVSHNTFFGFRSFLIWAGPTAPHREIKIRANLILETDEASRNLAEMGSKWFSQNYWDASARPGAEVGIARQIQDIPLVSTDPANPGFLRPVFEHVVERLLSDEEFPGRYAAP